jgi:hypothetical protein
MPTVPHGELADDPGALRDWVRRWERVVPILEEQRERDARGADAMSAFSFFAGLVSTHLESGAARPETSSGLVEQQRLFRLVRPKI